MDKSLWRSACEEFLEIADLPANQRGSYLGCLEPALRRGVESLLAADAEAERFLEEPACPRHITESLKAAARAAPELRLGPYHLERELSQSRMSRVFLARRDDGEFEKEVLIFGLSCRTRKRYFLAGYFLVRQGFSLSQLSRSTVSFFLFLVFDRFIFTPSSFIIIIDII